MHGNFYECINTRDYLIHKLFQFLRPYLFLSSLTKIISVVPFYVAENEKEKDSCSTFKIPIRTKKAKVEIQGNNSKTRRWSLESVDTMAKAMSMIQKTNEQKQELEHQMNMKNLYFEQQSFWYERADASFGVCSSAPDEQRQEAVRLCVNV